MYRAALLAIVLGLVAWDLSAQTQPALGSDGEVGAVFSLRSGVSTAADRVVPLLGMGFGLRLSSSFQLGGEGLMGLRTIRVSAEDSPDRSELTLGYGGVSLIYRFASDPGITGLHGGVLLGAGTARIRSSLADAEVGTDNFGIMEPFLEYRLRLRSPLGAAIGVGYRFTPGSDSLPGVPAGELSGPVLSIGLQLMRNP